MRSLYAQIAKKLAAAPQLTSQKLLQIKRNMAGNFKIDPPPNFEILNAYRQLVKTKKIQSNKRLEKLLQRRGVRTRSGVAPVAVLTKPYPCPGKCVYCPAEKAMPKSYLSNEPAVMRAIACNFDPYKQVIRRIEALEVNGHPTDKIELIIMGGTWSYFPARYQNWFVKRCFEACNNFGDRHPMTKRRHRMSVAHDLSSAQKRNERAKHRIVGLTLETRPDMINEKEIKRLRQLGCTKVEIGVQHLDDKILKLNKRGHTVRETIKATQMLRSAGFKIMYHLMPNLPGSTPDKDLKMFQQIFTDPRFQPDLIKIYPCVVTNNSTLYKWWKQGKYKPYTHKQLVNLLLNIKKITPPYVRIARLIRDIPEQSIVAGNKVSNLRQLLQVEMEKRKIKCKCIRCREIGHQKNFSEFVLRTLKLQTSATILFHVSGLKGSSELHYPVSTGIEHFLSFTSRNQDILYAFLRLHLPRENETAKKIWQTLPEIKNAALIREVHTYGHLMPLDDRHSMTGPLRRSFSEASTRHRVSVDHRMSAGYAQHKGLGKKLIKEAEKIARKNGYKKIAVISGIGVREYYRKLGYGLKGNYMVKWL